MNLQGKVAIITGASSGIGAGTAKHFANLGVNLVIVGRNKDNLKQVAENCECLNTYGKVVPVVADVTVEDDVKRIIDVTIEHFNKIDILLNSAGIIGNGSIENTSLEQYDSIMNTNVRSIYHVTMLAVPHLIKTKGVIINISSVTGMRAFPGVLAYCMSKAAVDQFTRCIALELAPKGVRVNCVNPGVIVTELHKRGGMDDKIYENFLEKSKQTHALGRAGNVDEVANTIAFLASDCSSFVTGASVPVDGGRHAMVDKFE